MAIDPNVIDFISQAVSKFGVDPAQPVDVTDPLTRLTMAVIITNIEQGRDIYSYDQFVKGSAMSAGVDPATYNTLVNAVSLGFENFQSAGGFVSPATPSVAAGGSSVPTNISNYIQFGPSPMEIVKSTISATESIISSTQAILAVNSLNGINPLTGISAPTGVNTDNPIGNFFSGIGQKISGAVDAVTNSLGITTSNNNSAVTGAVQSAPDGGGIMLIFAGTNDYTSTGNTANNIAQMAQAAKDKGYTPVFVAPNANINNIGNNNAQDAVIAGAKQAGAQVIVRPDSDFQKEGTTGNYHLKSSAMGDIAQKAAELVPGQEVKIIAGDSNGQRAIQALKIDGTATQGISTSTILTNIKSDAIPTVATISTSAPTANELAAAQQEYSNSTNKANVGETVSIQGRSYRVGQDDKLVPQATGIPNVTTTQTAANADTAKAAETVAFANGYTVKTPIANENGTIVGFVASNPIDRSYVVYNNVNGQLKNPDGSTIKTAADLPPSLSDTLTSAGYTDKQVLPNGTIRYFNNNRFGDDPAGRPTSTVSNDYVEVSTNGTYTYSGAAATNVQSVFTGKQLDYLNVTTVATSTSTNPIFTGSTTYNIVETARTLSGGIQNPITLPSINTAIGGINGVGGNGTISGAVDLSQSNNALKGFFSATTSATNAANNYQLEINSQQELIKSYGVSAADVRSQIDDLEVTREALLTAKSNTDEAANQAILERIDTVTRNQTEIQDLNNQAFALNSKINSLESQLVGTPKFSGAATDIANQKLAATLELQGVQAQISSKQQEIGIKTQEITDIVDGKLSVTPSGVSTATIDEQIKTIDSQLKDLGDLSQQYSQLSKNAADTATSLAGDLARTNSAINVANSRVSLPVQINQAAADVKASADQVVTLQKLLDNPAIPQSTKADLQEQLKIATDDFNQKTEVFSELKNQQLSYGQVQGPQVSASWTPVDSGAASNADRLSLISFPAGSSEEAYLKSQGTNEYYQYVNPDGSKETWFNGEKVDNNTGLPPQEILPPNSYDTIDTGIPQDYVTDPGITDLPEPISGSDPNFDVYIPPVEGSFSSYDE